MTDLPALAERLRAATEPDRELDYAIWMALCWKKHYKYLSADTPFTASIDAALALVGRDETVSWRIILEEALDEALILKRLPLCILRRYIARKMWIAGLIAKEADDE